MEGEDGGCRWRMITWVPNSSHSSAEHPPISLRAMSVGTRCCRRSGPRSSRRSCCAPNPATSPSTSSITPSPCPGPAAPTSTPSSPRSGERRHPWVLRVPWGAPMGTILSPQAGGQGGQRRRLRLQPRGAGGGLRGQVQGAEQGELPLDRLRWPRRQPPARQREWDKAHPWGCCGSLWEGFCRCRSDGNDGKGGRSHRTQ